MPKVVLEYARRAPVFVVRHHWLPVLFGLLSFVPVSALIAIEYDLVSASELWFDARDHILAYGVMGVGPLIGVLSFLTRLADSSGARGAQLAGRSCGALAMLLGVIVSALFVGYTWVFFFWNIVLLTVLAFVTYRRRING